MMPGAGLYLPDTLSKSFGVAGTRTSKPEYVGHRPSQERGTSRESVATPTRSTEDFPKVFSSLSTVFGFANWASKQSRASPDGEVFANNIQRVRRDTVEASRLFTSQAVTDYLESWPDKKTWIFGIIHDATKALNDIGITIETVHVSGDDGGIAGLNRKFQWVLSHQKKLMSKQQHLMLCHQSLMSAIQLMQRVEMIATSDPIHELPAPPPRLENHSTTDFIGTLRPGNWSTIKQEQSSVPTIAVARPHVKENKIVNRYENEVAELSGSTPDDLFYQNQRLDANSPKLRSQSVGGAFPLTADQIKPRLSLSNEATDPIIVPMRSNQSIGQAPRRHPPDPPTMSRFSEHIRPAISTLDERACASFDMARPRAHSEQTQKRSELPSFPSQTSLMDDLSDWVIPRSTHESDESRQSVETIDSISDVSVNKSLFVDSSASKNHDGSSKSSPLSTKATQALPSRFAPPPIPPKIPLNDAMEPNIVMQSTSHHSFHRSGSAAIPPPLGRRKRTGTPAESPTFENGIPVRETTEELPTVDAPPSSVTHVGVLPTTELVSRTETPSIPWQTTLPTGESQIWTDHQNSLHHLTSSASATDKYPIALSLVDAPAVPKLTRHGLPTSESNQSFSSSHQSRITLSNASATDKYPIPSPPIPNVETFMSEAIPAPEVVRPMTALGKRRAAHAKRMEMAFGSD